MSDLLPPFAADRDPAGPGLAVAGVSVDWRHPLHRGRAALPCRFGDGDTQERDEQDRPCHRRCAEAELGRELLGRSSRNGAAFTDERVRAPRRPAGASPVGPQSGLSHPSFTHESEHRT